MVVAFVLILTLGPPIGPQVLEAWVLEARGLEAHAPGPPMGPMLVN